MEHMKRGCFDVLLGCGNQELDRQLSSAVEETRQAMFTQVNDFKKRQVTLMLQLQQHDHVDLQKIQSDLIQHWSTLCQEHASTSAAQLPLIHHLQQQTEGMQGTSSVRHNHMMTKALHTIIGQNHNTTSQVHTLTLLMNDMMEEMNRRSQQDLHVNKTEHEITRQQVNRLVVAKDWHAQQPGALDSQSTVQRLSQVVQPLKGNNAKSIGRLGNARKRHIFMSSQSLILSDEEAHALQAVAQKEHNAHVALQLGRGGTGAAAGAMQWGGGSAGPAAAAAPPAEALQLVGGDAVAAITAMHWKSSATGLEAAAIPHADALQLGRGGTGAATAAMQWRGDLNLVLQNYSKSLKSNIRNKPTLYKLAESLITGNKEGCLKEFTPEEYEKKVLKNDLSIFTEPSSSWK
ncbi:hypothetical protein CEUSTIGMA_g4361.t1 [Chlamydomonas eustigma]|uniref:Uncharacterized protein n=1 Tax=Chlamydomonas eustigma TaxID=1157962 RepID=A0A250X1H7_9CHLO|nr:hypothetical protein CEUSTIGMA_g4361.t1 [Chlamydomonas eustigma]|eukprot:GAX76915.1 hypothetical protein CEUSTIGMA_g4361.t1 [Chlamydomonas eustigma]